ncbi:MAG: molybdopterin dinucleotide binding domain-containing protein [Methanocellales archaeon]|nr:molybdopterin dinucleotide binding domain-containing protein [Methanocellales archaeon]MDD3291462.1 molybdopterin dinucleotide binding domain-containing protein [Methanocellales archaeon]MDD5234648.1 molybdopterin dinucleotide binding domain-containing protein [Methanocellales archaeon]MDD5484999.1 molybdopterin dinucleotide binding domain-containing protein [Methanocellales archaeon]
MKKIDVKLTSGRSIEQGIHIDNKMSSGYCDVAAVCELNEVDMSKLGIRDGANVMIKSKFGQVVVRVRTNNRNPPGIAFVPMGPWANAIMDPSTGGCGTPQFKGIEVEITLTFDSISPIKELVGFR